MESKKMSFTLTILIPTLLRRRRLFKNIAVPPKTSFKTGALIPATFAKLPVEGGFNNQDDATKDDTASNKEKGNVTDSGGDAGGFTNDSGATKDASKGVIRDGVSSNMAGTSTCCGNVRSRSISGPEAREDGAAIETIVLEYVRAEYWKIDLAQALQEAEDVDTGQRNGDAGRGQQRPVDDWRKRSPEL
jgi:hypothetical protein